jgi:hypothetical protein
MTGREKEIVRHLIEDDLDHLLTRTDDEKVSKRLIFIKRLYKGATLEDAADDVGMSQSTGSCWIRLWNKGGLGLLTPSFEGGRPPKLDGKQRVTIVSARPTIRRLELSRTLRSHSKSGSSLFTPTSASNRVSDS